VPLDETSAGAGPALRASLFEGSSLSTGGVLALDLSGAVGWAYGVLTDGVPATGEWELQHREGPGGLLGSLENILDKYMALWKPAIVVTESPLPPMVQTNTRTCAQQYGLDAVARIAAWRSSAAFTSIDVLTARSEVMGVRRMSKDIVKREVMLFCRRRGVRAVSHHAADAAVIWLWHRQRMLGIAPCAGPLWGGTIQ